MKTTLPKCSLCADTSDPRFGVVLRGVAYPLCDGCAPGSQEDLGKVIAKLATAPEPPRTGNWMQTFTGRAFFPLDPRPNDFVIEDIAHALSLICRFGGQCTEFYSVAEHCCRVADAIAAAGGTREEQFEGLMHERAEAYVGDMVWPLKVEGALRAYRDIEAAIESASARTFGLSRTKPSIVKHFDLVLLSTEKRDLMVPGIGREDGAAREANAAREALGAWHSADHAALPSRIFPFTPAMAKSKFLERFAELSKRGAT